MARLAITVGHNKKAQGAVRTTDKRTEYDWMSELASEIRALDRDNVEIFLRVSHGRRYTAEINKVYGEVDDWGADASIELHFNGAASPLVSGTETLSSGSRGSVALAKSVQSAMLNTLGLRNRGIKYPGQIGRGGRSLFAGKAPAILVEPYFGSSPSDCEIADENMKELAKEIYQSAMAVIDG
jgi:N-acetylmuramoyl-L-alanine amidase